MKKTLFVILAALFAIALIATCDLFEEPLATKDDTPKTTPDGRPLVTVTLNIEGLDIGDSDASNSRAMTLASAKTDVNAFDVIFKDGDDYYGVKLVLSGTEATGTVSVPPSNYDLNGANVNKAVVFAGTGDTLLAVGRITSVGGDTSSTTITNDGEEVVFTLTALYSDFFDADSGSFKITTAGDYSGNSSIKATNYRVYEIPKPGSSAVGGQFTVTWGTGTTNNTRGISYTSGCTIYTALPIVELSGIGDTSGTVGSVTISSINTSFSTTGTTLSTVTFNITPPTSAVLTNVYSKIYMEIPVHPLGTSLTWYIRGGIDYDTLDGFADTGTTSTKGGAVLLHSQQQMRTVNIIVDTDETK